MDFRRGAEAIKASAEAAKQRGTGGNFRPFAPSIFWRDTDEDRARYLLILNTPDEFPTVNTIGFIPVEDSKVGETVIARNDPAIGEDSDPMLDAFEGAKLTESNILAAVELDPVIETVNGRPRPRGFEVKTKEFSRRVRDEDGELTEETEDVVAPAVGLIMQRPSNFGSLLVAFDESEAPINETPVKISRTGSGNSMSFNIQGYFDQEVDLTNLIDFVDGITYLNDEMDELVEEIDGLEPLEAAHVIGNFLLDKRLEELADPDRYMELFEGIDDWPDKFGTKSEKKTKKTTRAAKPSQRRKKTEPEVEEEASVEEKPAKKTRATRTSRAKKTEEAPAEETSTTGTKSKLDELRARAQKNKA